MYHKTKNLAKGVLLFALVLALLPMLCIPMSSPAHAYELMGPTWDSVDPLNVHIHWNQPILYKAVWMASVQHWNQQPTNVNFVYQGPTDILCRTVNVPGAEWDGLAAVYSPIEDPSRIVYADLLLNQGLMGSYSLEKRASVASHELGHALGLADVAWWQPAVMNEATYWRYDYFGIGTPQQDDINGVNALY